MPKRFQIPILSVLIIFASLTLAISSVSREKREELFRQVELFADTLAVIQADYVDEVKPKDLIYGALRGMLASLDPHSQFMDPDTYNELKVDTEGKFGGLGIEITIKDGVLTVITPIEDTPAWKAGLKPGDRIIKINNELSRDMTLSEAVKRMRGRPGEVVAISVLRESDKKILEFKITRDIIKIKDIKEAKILESGIAYIRLSEFRENTSNNLNQQLKRLSRLGMRSFILDLRNNPGGLLESAVEVTEKFIPSGEKIVYTKGRKSAQNTDYFASLKDPILDLPMVVLINEGSASGSEIVAGCLQDYKRATIIGEKSFGKGSVQTVIPLVDGSALRLTTAKYYTPKGKEIHGKGVIPNIIVIEPKKPITDLSLDILPLKKPLNYKEDIQIMRAVNFLKNPKKESQDNEKKPKL